MPRIPTSNDDKKRRGNPGKRQDAPELRALPAAVPDPPEWLDDVARAEYKRLADALEPAEILADADQPILAMYALDMAMVRRLASQLAGSVTAKGVYGTSKKSPALGAYMQASKAALDKLDRLGGNPRARQALRMFKKEAEESDPFKLIDGGASVLPFAAPEAPEPDTE